MPTENTYKIRTNKSNLYLRIARGHFATSHSHTNYYIDVTKQKTRLSEAKAAASELAAHYNGSAVINTILCLDGTEVIGACIANELTKASLSGMNSGQTINILPPEYTSGSQLIFRDSVSPMITGNNVLILAASVVTGFTARGAVEAINYYGGNVAGICSIFAITDECMGYPVRSIFDLKDLSDYVSYGSHECPMCKNGQKIDALINRFGYSKLEY
jgi:orotate phosphoribosyltransferase